MAKKMKVKKKRKVRRKGIINYLPYMAGVRILRWDGREDSYKISLEEIKRELLERDLFDLLGNAKLGVYSFKKERYDRFKVIEMKPVDCEEDLKVYNKIYYESMKQVLRIMLTHFERLDYYYLLQNVRGNIIELVKTNGFGVGMFLNFEKEIIKRLAKDGGLV